MGDAANIIRSVRNWQKTSTPDGAAYLLMEHADRIVLALGLLDQWENAAAEEKSLLLHFGDNGFPTATAVQTRRST